MAVEVPHRRRWTFAGSSDGGFAEDDGFMGASASTGAAPLTGPCRKRESASASGVAASPAWVRAISSGVGAVMVLWDGRRVECVQVVVPSTRKCDVADCGAGVSLGVRFFFKRDVF